MSTSSRGLGRGLGALIPTTADVPRGTPSVIDDLTSIPGLQLVEVDIAELQPNPRQPRQVFDEEALAELAHSLTEVGFLQPIVVRRAESGTGFEIIAGERRWRAAQQAGLARVPVLIKSTADEFLLRDALLENLHRVQLNPLEEAAAYAQLLEDFGCTQEELATRLGRSRPAISNSLRLLRLPNKVQLRVAAGVLTPGHAKVLASMSDPVAMESLALRIVKEGMSVRATEDLLAVEQPERKQRRLANRSASSNPFQYLADDLSDRLDTRVRITGSSGRGKIGIEFGSADDLQRILAALRDPVTWQ